jgi:predicted PurR-regulated permease PerM
MSSVTENAPQRPVQATATATTATSPKASLPTHATRRTTPVAPPRQVQLVALEPRMLRRSVISVLLVVTAWLVALSVLSSIGSFLFILLLSWLFAISMEPAIDRLTARGLRRGTATGIVGGLVLLVTLLLGVLFGNLFFQQLSQLVAGLPTVVTNVIEWLNATLRLQLDATTITDRLRLTPDQVGVFASQLAGGVLGIVTSLLTVLLQVFTFIVFAFYIAADGPRIRRAIGSWLPPQRQEVFVTVWDIASQKTGGYVVSKFVLAAVSALFHAVFFWWIGVPYWLPLSVLVGITAQFIPVIGTYIGVVVPVIFVIFTTPLTALWIVLFALVFQQIETYVFTPRISKRTMDVNSGIALAAVFVGAGIWGPIGALIGIPLAAAVVAVVQTYGRRYELVPELAARETGEPEEVVVEVPGAPAAAPPSGAAANRPPV